MGVPKGRNDDRVGARGAGGSAGTHRRDAAVAAASVAAGDAVGRLRNPGRVLWWSNAPWASTGYGTQTAAVTRRLKAAGYEVAVAANFGFAGGVTEWEGMPVLPQGFDGHSQDVMFAHWDAWRSERPSAPCPMVTLYDTWVLKQPRLAEIPVIGSWVPVDHLPAPPDVVAWCAKPNVVPIAMARFGQAMLERAGVEARYVPHSVDTKVFRPGAKLPDGRSGRALYGADDDRFVIMMNAANKGTLPTRKAFAENLLAVSELIARTGGDDSPVLLYMHTEPNNGIGINLFELLQAVGIGNERVRWVDAYAYRNGLISDEYLAALTASADVLLATSRGEGFGIPAIEAQACGTRVIVSDFSAQPELVGDGWLVDGQPEWDPFQKAWFHSPRIAGIVDALEQAFLAPREPSAKAVEHAAGYDHDVVFAEFWRPVLDELVERAR